MTDREKMIEVIYQYIVEDDSDFVCDDLADRLIAAGFGMAKKWDAESMHKEMLKNGYCGPSTRESADRIVKIINGDKQ